MNKEIPEFGGRTVQAGVARVSGRTSEKVGALENREEIVFVGVGTVTSIAHRDFKTTTGRGSPSLYSRIHDVKGTRVIVLPRSDPRAADLLANAAQISQESFEGSSLLTQQVEGDGDAEEDEES